MARLQELVANLLCHEAVSFLIYGTVFLLLLFYIPYWIRQQLDRHYLKFLAKKAREKYFQQRMELCQKNPEMSVMHSEFIKEDDENYEFEKKTDMELMPLSVVEKESDEKISLLSPHSSRLIQCKQ